MRIGISHKRAIALTFGVLIAMTVATVKPEPALAQEGALVGGAIGLGVGAALTRGSAAGVIGGALIGGVVGNEIQKDQRRKKRANYNKKNKR